MSPLGHILRHGVPMAMGTAVQVVVAFGANLVLARHLLPAEFGRFALVQAGVGLLLSVLSLRLITVILRTPAEDMTLETRRRLFTWMLVQNATVLALLAGWALMSGDLDFWDCVLGLSIVLGNWLNENRAFFERRQDFRGLVRIETGVQITGHLAAVVMVAAGMGASVLYLREVFFVAASIGGLAWMGGLSLYRPVMLRLADFRALYRDIRGIWLDGMLEGSFQRLTLLAVNTATSLTGTGLFFQAHRLAVVPHQFISPVIGRVLASWVGATENAALRRATRTRILLLLGGGLSLAAAAAYALADPLIPWIFGPNWAPAAPVLQALTGMIVFLSLFEALRCFAVMTKRVRLLLVARIGQYGGFVLPLLPLAWGGAVSVETMGLALSSAYAVAFVTLLLSFLFNERDE